MTKTTIMTMVFSKENAKKVRFPNTSAHNRVGLEGNALQFLGNEQSELFKVNRHLACKIITKEWNYT